MLLAKPWFEKIYSQLEQGDYAELCATVYFLIASTMGCSSTSARGACQFGLLLLQSNTSGSMNSSAQDALKKCPSYYESDATCLEQLEKWQTDCKCRVQKLQNMRLIFELEMSVQKIDDATQGRERN